MSDRHRYSGETLRNRFVRLIFDGKSNINFAASATTFRSASTSIVSRLGSGPERSPRTRDPLPVAFTRTQDTSRPSHRMFTVVRLGPHELPWSSGRMFRNCKLPGPFSYEEARTRFRERLGG